MISLRNQWQKRNKGKIMAVAISVTLDKTRISLGETVTATYSCSGSFDCQLQADNMPQPITFGSGTVSGTMKFLPVVSGGFTVTLTALGDIGRALGLNVDQVETTVDSASCSVI
jgi:hypothetical protein